MLPLPRRNEFKEGQRFSRIYACCNIYVLSNVEIKNTKVSWGSGENDTASIQTGHNDIHFQAINCQTKFIHKVDAISRVKKGWGTMTTG